MFLKQGDTFRVYQVHVYVVRKHIRKLIDQFDKTLFCAISVPKRRLAVVDGFKVVRSEIPNTLFTTHNKLIA